MKIEFLTSYAIIVKVILSCVFAPISYSTITWGYDDMRRELRGSNFYDS